MLLVIVIVVHIVALGIIHVGLHGAVFVVVFLVAVVAVIVVVLVVVVFLFLL